jgi:hypothetical protein
MYRNAFHFNTTLGYGFPLTSLCDSPFPPDSVRAGLWQRAITGGTDAERLDGATMEAGRAGADRTRLRWILVAPDI